mmetsp:Transcript_316/g.441  ORF Transcript_316/g.441 Transcript_316/m.441 type:complete len:163 (-) Transcript_316:92-580(-)|eukprot:CAMPEP_0201500542 /NCGR_PEP_ID=MMETSP0151_2-20130828/82010_1 /ASSEMBLY_ACC=CAM_ASM_000257 /TAXON_ID=200890 /ORGANISM="Paramoeba atlantica, Strain 621/1 / CCAP 1560/9" /LENGTH=162 /DNA_ID=CAMNT_0047893825 /DNA_START=131 /DNA_END=619 /DNA_ORIENTATION=+
MPEDFNVTEGTKEEQYQTLLEQILSVVDGETDLVANLANISAMLKEQFNWLWVGFYIVKETQLVLGPFQGPLACTRIKKGRGVCGNSWSQAKTMIVSDVSKFPGHIACSSKSQSEIVVPIIRNDTVVAILDVDSEKLSQFDEVDGTYLEKLMASIAWEKWGY